MKTAAVRGWLLDTHALLWMLYGDRRLTASARRLIEGDIPLHYSTVSFWEIALKRSTKGFDFSIAEGWEILLPRELHRLGMVRVDLEATDCRALESLELIHRDPFDRMLVAQARAEGATLVTADRDIRTYAVPTMWE